MASSKNLRVTPGEAIGSSILSISGTSRPQEPIVEEWAEKSWTIQMAVASVAPMASRRGIAGNRCVQVARVDRGTVAPAIRALRVSSKT